MKTKEIKRNEKVNQKDLETRLACECGVFNDFNLDIGLTTIKSCRSCNKTFQPTGKNIDIAEKFIYELLGARKAEVKDGTMLCKYCHSSSWVFRKDGSPSHCSKCNKNFPEYEEDIQYVRVFEKDARGNLVATGDVMPDPEQDRTKIVAPKYKSIADMIAKKNSETYVYEGEEKAGDYDKSIEETEDDELEAVRKASEQAKAATEGSETSDEEADPSTENTPEAKGQDSKALEDTNEEVGKGTDDGNITIPDNDVDELPSVWDKDGELTASDIIGVPDELELQPAAPKDTVEEPVEDEEPAPQEELDAILEEVEPTPEETSKLTKDGRVKKKPGRKPKAK